MKRTFKIDSAQSLKICLGHIKTRSPGPLKIIVDDWKDNRSDALNRLLWLWNGTIQKFLAETQGIIAKSDDIHEELVENLLPLEYRINMAGQKAAQRARTSKMNNKELCNYLEMLEVHCTVELGMNGDYRLPNPDDLKYRSDYASH
jgi:hypothetical protein